MKKRFDHGSCKDYSNCEFTTIEISALAVSHIGTYRILQKFIKGYAQITASMEKLLKKDTKFQGNENCQQGLDNLKEKMVTTPILVFPY